MPTLQRYKYAELLANLEGIDRWLHQLGLDSKQDRVHFAIDVLREAEHGFQEARAAGRAEKIGNIEEYMFGLCEALEIHDIYRAFRDEATDRLSSTLERALSGPHRPALENARNADGRNVGFELALAADLRLRGAAITLEEPDLKIMIDNHHYLLACKRPLRQAGIPACIRGATRQLREHLNNGGEQVHGVVAISVSRILNPGTHFFIRHLEVLGDRVQELLTENKIHCQRAAREVPAICAVLFHIATPGEIDGLLVRMNFSVLFDAGVPSAAFERLARHVGPLYD
jgi:hypothetical protein